LGTNVDIPPNGEVEDHLLVKDVLDFTSSLTGVGLNIDRFDRVVRNNVSEGNVSDASIVGARRNGTNSHTNTKDNFGVLNENILSAIGNLIVAVTGLDSNSIIEVGDLNIVDMDVLTSRVNTVSVKRESGVVDGVVPGTVELEQVLLLPDINEDFHVVDFEVGNITEVQVIVRGVLPLDTSDFAVGNSLHLEKAWATSGVGLNVLTHPPSETLTINKTGTVDLDVSGVIDSDEIIDVGASAVLPVHVVLRG